jgi:myosin-5
MDVTYDTAQFMAKNLDMVSPDCLELMLSSSLPFVRDLFSQSALRQHLQTDGPAHGRRTAPTTVCSRFKASLAGLMDALDATEPHYIRCIKPNAQQSGYLSSAASTLTYSPGLGAGMPMPHMARAPSNPSLATPLDARVVLDQLHAAGVIDVVRISQAGYPYRWSYPAFLQRYGGIGIGAGARRAGHPDPRAAAVALCSRVCGEGCAGIQYGATMVFMRAAEMYRLDHKLHVIEVRAATRIQAGWRGMQARTVVHQWRAAAVRIAAGTNSSTAPKVPRRPGPGGSLGEGERDAHAMRCRECNHIVRSTAGFWGAAGIHAGARRGHRRAARGPRAIGAPAVCAGCP